MNMISGPSFSPIFSAPTGLFPGGNASFCPCEQGGINQNTQQIYMLELLLGLLLGVMMGQGLNGNNGFGGNANGNAFAGAGGFPANSNGNAGFGGGGGGGGGGGAPVGGGGGGSASAASSGGAASGPHGPISEADKQWLTGDVDGLNPELAGALAQVGQRIGKKIDVRSGFRSRQEQEVLYQKYLNGTGNLAAKPGSSNHEGGNAADVYVDGVALNSHPQAAQAAREVGIHFPVGGEPWHAELRGVRA